MTTTQSKIFWSLLSCRLARRCESQEMLLVFAAARRVLDKVVPTGTLAARDLDDLPHGIELVIPGEDQRLLHQAPLPPLPVVDLLLLPLDEHEMPEDI
jgi:hypothetical protein